MKGSFLESNRDVNEGHAFSSNFSLRMEQILNSFGDIVENAADSLRLHEECDLLSLRIDKATRAS